MAQRTKTSAQQRKIDEMVQRGTLDHNEAMAYAGFEVQS